MGLGDNLMATGLARGAAARGKRIAFGQPGGITQWDKHSATIFQGNPNIAQPGTERAADVEWIQYHTGHRLYNELAPNRTHWVWHAFHPIPGEVFLSEEEQAWAAGIGSGYIIMEPSVDSRKRWAVNKVWMPERYNQVADALVRLGHEVVQLRHPATSHIIPRARIVQSPSFRHALAALSRAALYIGSEGGMHHGAAAVGIPGVVVFGGFIPPSSTGYSTHVNMTGGTTQFCGQLRRCSHCRMALHKIRSIDVIQAARRILDCDQFDFISNVPEAARPQVRRQVAAWVETRLSPVVGVHTPVGEVDFCRRPWPPEPGVRTTVGAERDWDEVLLRRLA